MDLPCHDYSDYYNNVSTSTFNEKVFGNNYTSEVKTWKDANDTSENCFIVY